MMEEQTQKEKMQIIKECIEDNFNKYPGYFQKYIIELLKNEEYSLIISNGKFILNKLNLINNDKLLENEYNKIKIPSSIKLEKLYASKLSRNEKVLEEAKIYEEENNKKMYWISNNINIETSYTDVFIELLSNMIFNEEIEQIRIIQQLENNINFVFKCKLYNLLTKYIKKDDVKRFDYIYETFKTDLNDISCIFNNIFFNNAINCLKFFIEKNKIDINIKLNSGLYLLHIAVISDSNNEMLNYLIKKEINILNLDNNNYTAINYARSVRMYIFLLEYYPNFYYQKINNKKYYVIDKIIKNINKINLDDFRRMLKYIIPYHLKNKSYDNKCLLNIDSFFYCFVYKHTINKKYKYFYEDSLKKFELLILKLKEVYNLNEIYVKKRILEVNNLDTNINEKNNIQKYNKFPLFVFFLYEKLQSSRRDNFLNQEEEFDYKNSVNKLLFTLLKCGLNISELKHRFINYTNKINLFKEKYFNKLNYVDFENISNFKFYIKDIEEYETKEYKIKKEYINSLYSSKDEKLAEINIFFKKYIGLRKFIGNKLLNYINIYNN